VDEKFEGSTAQSALETLGNHLIARTMLIHDVAAALNVPVRVHLYEASNGTVRFGYHLLSSLRTVYQNEAVMAACLKLDEKLAALASKSTGSDHIHAAIITKFVTHRSRGIPSHSHQHHRPRGVPALGQLLGMIGNMTVLYQHQGAGLHPSQIILELTEHDPIPNTADLFRVLDPFLEEGCNSRSTMWERALPTCGSSVNCNRTSSRWTASSSMVSRRALSNKVWCRTSSI
jgi:hypothetical protein